MELLSCGIRTLSDYLKLALQANKLDDAVQLFGDVLQVRIAKYGGEHNICLIQQNPCPFTKGSIQERSCWKLLHLGPYIGQLTSLVVALHKVFIY